MRRLLFVLGVTLGIHSAPLRAQDTPLQTGDSLLPFRRGAVLWAYNPTPDTVWVDTLFLSACRNLMNRCGATPLNLPIPPHAGRRLAQITEKIPREGLGYRWTFSWRVVTREEMEEEPEDTTDSVDDDNGDDPYLYIPQQLMVALQGSEGSLRPCARASRRLELSCTPD